MIRNLYFLFLLSFYRYKNHASSQILHIRPWRQLVCCALSTRDQLCWFSAFLSNINEARLFLSHACSGNKRLLKNSPSTNFPRIHHALTQENCSESFMKQLYFIVGSKHASSWQLSEVTPADVCAPRGRRCLWQGHDILVFWGFFTLFFYLMFLQTVFLWYEIIKEVNPDKKMWKVLATCLPSTGVLSRNADTAPCGQIWNIANSPRTAESFQ